MALHRVAFTRAVEQVAYWISGVRRYVSKERSITRGFSGGAPPEQHVNSHAEATGIDHQAALVHAFSRMLELADRLPAGEAEDDVRRCVYEVIEADTDPAKRVRIDRLLDSIAVVQKRFAAGSRADAIECGASVIEQLLGILTKEIVPTLNHRPEQSAS